jgi:hypothetical protein
MVTGRGGEGTYACPGAQNFLDLVGNTNAHAARRQSMQMTGEVAAVSVVISVPFQGHSDNVDMWTRVLRFALQLADTAL